MSNISVLSFFWTHIRPYKSFYLIMILAPLVTSFSPFAYNYAIKLFLDVMASSSLVSYHEIVFPIFLLISQEVIVQLIWRISDIAEWKSEPYVRRSILLKSYDYIQHHSYKFFQEYLSGIINSKLKGLLDGYDKFWSEMHHGLLLRVFNVIVSLCALLWINLYLGIIVFVWSFLYMALTYWFSLKLNRLSHKETESLHGIMGQISDRISNIYSLFSFAARKRELQTLEHQISHDFIPKQIRSYKYHFKTQVISGLLYLLLTIFLLFTMIHLRKKGLISVGDFAFVFSTAYVLMENVWNAMVSFQDFSRVMGNFKSSLSLLNIPQVKEEECQPLVITKATIEFKDVWFQYTPEDFIFKNFNCLIQEGEKIGLVGPSGAGKSSLINLLLKYFSPTQGKILVSGQDIHYVTADSLRENIAIVPQDTYLFHRTLIENIRYGKPTASDEEVIGASKKAHLHEFIEGLPEGYYTLVGERGIKLSGGQRQRIAIARAILKDAPILILDEATSSLDNQTEKLIQDSLSFLIQRKTVIAIAHRLSTLRHMDRILVLNKGRIIEEGTHHQLMTKNSNLYKDLWHLQEN